MEIDKKTHLEEEKEMPVAGTTEKVGIGQHFGVEELLLKIPRQTTATAEGKTIVLSLNELSVVQYWIKNKYDNGIGDLANLLNMNNTSSMFSDMNAYQKFMVLFTSYR